MEFNKDTKLKDILNAYPWLKEELLKQDKRFEQLDTPLGKIFMKKATIGDLGKKAGKTPEELIETLKVILAEHQE